MFLNMYSESIGHWFSRFFSFNTLVIGLVTIGLLFVLTVVSYGIDQWYSRYKFDTTLFDEVTWFICLGLAMFFLQEVFTSLNVPENYHEIAWQYSNAQLIVLFFCLYIVKKKSILVFNAILPIFLYGLGLERNQLSPNLAGIVGILVIIGISYYIYKHSNRIIDNAIYYLTQAIFGGAWWVVLMEIQGLGIREVILLTLEFMFVMTIVHVANIEIRQISNRYIKLERVNGYDFLTNIRNRRSFDEVAQEVFDVYSLNTLPVSLAMFDIDNFKHFNDEYGHQVGDKVLKKVAQLFSKELVKRKMNAQVFRVGGEEFAIIFRNRAAKEVAPTLIEIRDILAGRKFKIDDSHEVGITVSIGISTLRQDDESFADFYRRVDQYLYQSKKNNRNSITVEGGVSSFE